ncbi:hypothetical protein HN446_02845 [bacterium]|jgi:hypothetical protein|nr:hypothetical protein [bacterium]
MKKILFFVFCGYLAFFNACSFCSDGSGKTLEESIKEIGSQIASMCLTANTQKELNEAAGMELTEVALRYNMAMEIVDGLVERRNKLLFAIGGRKAVVRGALYE